MLFYAFSAKLIFSAFWTALQFFEKTAFLESEKSLVFGLNSTLWLVLLCIFRPRITRTWSVLLMLKFSALPPGGLCFNPPSRLNARFSYPNRWAVRPPLAICTGLQSGRGTASGRAAPMGQLLTQKELSG